MERVISRPGEESAGLKKRFHPIGPAAIVTVLCGLTFLFLMGLRLGLFHRETPLLLPVSSPTEGKESWMTISQKDRKIGYSHRRISPHDDGYSLSESTHMRINTMGMVQDIHVRTTGELNADMSLVAFSFDLQSSLFHFKLHGRQADGMLTVFSGEHEINIPVEGGLFLTSSALDAALSTDMKPNDVRRFLIFDPSTMGQRPVQITMEGNEVLTIMGRTIESRRMSIEFMGTSQTAWIAEDGTVLREEGLLGLRLEQATEADALDGLALTSSTDLVEMVSIYPEGRMDNPLTLARLTLKITGIPEHNALDGGRQSYKDGILVVAKETVPAPGLAGADINRFVEPTAFIQSDHPDIGRIVSEIVSPEDSPGVKADKIMNWIYANIDKRPVLSVPNALETLKNRVGDCNEHAVLMAAMARAAGIPAQIEAGLVYMRGRFYYHAWNAIYLGRWITVDALLGQMPADVTHLRIVRGEPDKQIDLIGIIGKVGIEILTREE